MVHNYFLKVNVQRFSISQLKLKAMAVAAIKGQNKFRAATGSAGEMKPYPGFKDGMFLP